MTAMNSEAFWSAGRKLRTIAKRSRQVWRLISWRQRLSLGLALAIMCLSSGANTAIALSLGKMVDAVSPERTSAAARGSLSRVAAVYLAIIGVCYLVREVMNVLRRFLVEDACTRIDKDVFVRVLSHLMKVDLAVLTQDRLGSVYGRITRGVDGLVRFMRIGFLDSVPALLTGLFALAAALSKQPRIALAMVGVIPLSLGLTIWQLVTQAGVRRQLLRSRELIDGTVIEQLGGIDYIRAADMHRSEMKRVEHLAERRRAKELRHQFEMSLFGSGKAINEGFFHLVVLATAVFLLVQGEVKAGDILTFSVLYLNVMAPLNEVHRFVDEAHESSLRAGDLLSLLALPLDPSFKVLGEDEPRLAVGEPFFVADDLRVEFPTERGSGTLALDGLSLTIRHGERIGVAGRSGCGKTTWLRTILRLAHSSGGVTTFGGVPISCVSRQNIGKLVGYVGQNPFIFAGSIAENIAYGSKQATEEEIRSAAEQACVHEDIMEMPGQYQARVAERGQNLSGGQKQRIALARVFLKDPPILILDEATSALDNVSEQRVQQAISASGGDRTVILVAHRLTTLLQTDRILVFDKGRLVESGNYADLVESGGVFAELVNSAAGPMAEHQEPQGPGLRPETLPHSWGGPVARGLAP
jgi:ATP-binding cassette, subfamily B, bacterial